MTDILLPYRSLAQQNMDFMCLVSTQILLLVTGVFSMNDTAIDPVKVGSCSMTEDYLESVKQCESSFVKKLQGDKNANCSVAFSEFVDCVAAVTINCLRANVEDPKVLNSTEKDIRRETKKLVGIFCEKGTLTYPKQLQKMCNVTAKCGSDFFSNANECAKPFNDQFHDDWTSAKLCRLFAEGNRCVKKLSESKCKFDAYVKEIVLNEYKKHFNPWCPSNKDPKDFFEGYKAAGTLFSYGTLLVATAVGACVVLMSP